MVVCAGKITGVVDGREATKEKLGLLMTQTSDNQPNVELEDVVLEPDDETLEVVLEEEAAKDADGVILEIIAPGNSEKGGDEQ